MINRKELQKLNPRDRIKKLMELEEQRKKDVLEIEELIKQSAQELKINKIADDNAPPQAAIDISRLFHEEGNALEMNIRKETAEVQSSQQYQSLSQTYDDYKKLRQFMGYAMEGPLAAETIEAVDKIGERLQRFKYESASEEAVNLFVASRAVLHKIKRYMGLD